jgi:Zn-dependent protease
VDIGSVILVAIALLPAVVIHEVAHGWVAERFGDPTARDLGRISLNPIRHIDFFMTIVMPLLFLAATQGRFAFGGAKPVPVNPRYFSNPRRQMMWVALAGPVVNIILAAVSYGLLWCVAFLFHHSLIGLGIAVVLAKVILHSFFINALLAAFNLLPIPPLDGGRIVVGLLPEKLALPYAKLERFGLLTVIALVYFQVPSLVLDPLYTLLASLLVR